MESMCLPLGHTHLAAPSHSSSSGDSWALGEKGGQTNGG